MHGQGYSARVIARELGLARNRVLKYLTAPEAIVPKPRPLRGSKLAPYAEHIDRRMGEVPRYVDDGVDQERCYEPCVFHRHSAFAMAIAFSYRPSNSVSSWSRSSWLQSILSSSPWWLVLSNRRQKQLSRT